MDLNKKEMPIQGYTGFGGGATGAAFRSSADDKKYIDDVFAMAPWYGTAANKTIDNGINLSEDGGLVWFKNRDGNYQNIWQDTEQGINKDITPQTAAGQVNIGSGRLNQFNTNGFRVGSDTTVNNTNQKIMSWCFKKSPGFFDMVSWSGDSQSGRTISHNLECIPGFIAVKRMDGTGNWTVYHRGVNKGVNPLNYYMILNGGIAPYSNYAPFTSVSDTGFGVIADDNADEAYYMNKSGQDYQAYLWAGGESTAATAASVDFGGDNTTAKSYQRIAGSSPASWRDFGTANFTFEMWVRPDGLTTDNYHKRIFSLGSSVSACISLEVQSDGSAKFRYNDSIKVSSDARTVPIGQWTHIAVSRESNTLRMFINGTLATSGLDPSFTDDVDLSGSGNALWIGNLVDNGSGSWNGQISNFRIVKGTAVYTTSFKVPLEPLENITNTILLTCNDATNKNASTITPATKSGWGGETAKADSPFDDPAAFIFGEDADSPIIKTGHYVGNGNDTYGLEVEIGFEPSFVWIKSASADENWFVFDNMREMDNEKMDNTHTSGRIRSDSSIAETTTNDGLNTRPTGFRVSGDGDKINKDGDTYIYIAIRARDGYCSKGEAGTDIYAQAAGTATATHPSTYGTDIPVDMGWHRELFQSGTTNPATAGTYYSTRHFAAKGLNLHGSAGATDFVAADYSFNAVKGWAHGYPSNYFSAMFKRFKGLDLVSYKGNGTAGRHIRHSLNATPEMIITKNRNSTATAKVWHKDLNGGGSNAVNYHLELEDVSAAQTSNSDIYGSTAAILPNDTHWVLGGNAGVNENGSLHIAWAISSVAGVSKVGSYTGNGGTNVINLGFQPRFFLSRRVDTTNNTWVWIDTHRGWVDGADKWIALNSVGAQQIDDYGGIVTATGFTLSASAYGTNANGGTYIYWCIA